MGNKNVYDPNILELIDILDNIEDQEIETGKST
jgi:hypothetical protein